MKRPTGANCPDHDTEVPTAAVPQRPTPFGRPPGQPRSRREGSLRIIAPAVRQEQLRAAAHAGYLERGRIVRKLEWATRSSAPAKRLQVYVGPRDTPVLYAGTEVIELSPTEEFGRTMEVVTNNMEETQASS